VGCEERNNVSLIKIEATGLPILKFGSSKDVKTGQFAFTLGTPHQSILRDRQVAFSMGVISGIYRLRGDGDYTGRVIETDAALNNGSDGGPLINAKGEIIGILNLSYSYSKWLNVAVPVDQIKLIMKDLKEGSAIYPHYGMTPAEEAEPDGGVALTQVKRRGPAYKAGLYRGDVILEVDGLKIERPEQLSREMAILPPGSEMTLLVRRGDSELVVKLTSGKQVVKQEKPKPKPKPEPIPEVAAKERGSMGARITEEKDGLVITETAKDGAAEEAGLKPGDRILEANGKKVRTLGDLQAVFKDLHAGDKLELLAERDGWTKKMTLTLKKK
jgi:serine protease Do